MQPGQPPDPWGRSDDDATRHLCAAVHVDDAFADDIVTEFLTEPRRAIPPSPGLDSTVALSEALSARRRRVLRDSLAIVLLVAIVVLGGTLSLLWLGPAIIGVLLGASRNVQQRRDGTQSAAPSGRSIIVAIVAVVLGYLFLRYLGTAGYFPGAVGAELDLDDLDDLAALATGNFVAMSLLGAVALSVLFADRLYVHHLLRRRFHRMAWNQQRGWHHGYPVPAPPAQAWYAPRLQLIHASAADSNAHVHYDYKAFVGAGTPTRSWTVVTRLRPKSEGTTPEALTPTMLYQAVTDEVLALRNASGLTPGQRLTTLAYKHEVIASANALLYYRDHPLSAAILPNPELPPENRIDPRLIEGMLDQPPEWVRPYLRFQIDGWGRQLVVSAYLHIGCHDDMLSIEFDALQLNPVRQEYEVERMPLNYPHQVVWRGLLDAATLPFSVPRRLRTLWRAMRDASGIRPRTDLFDPARMYGARRSIREIAADADTTTFFEDIDGIRYLRLLENRTLTAVVNALSAHGWDSDEVSKQSTTIVNASTMISGGNVVAGNIGGQANQVQVGQPPASQPEGSGGGQRQ